MIHRAIGMIILCFAMATLKVAFAGTPTPPSPSDAQTTVAFQARLSDYLALHHKLESKLPKMPTQGTPEQAEQHRRSLGALVQSARQDAKPGDFFTPGMQALAKRILGAVLAGPEGRVIRASIMDENPGVPKLVVNERYPSSLPLATMPPQVLTQLPKLLEFLEYRFVGSRLILLDTRCDIILDFTDDVLPR
jgi:hypothetical protein